VIIYRASLDVPEHTVSVVTRWLREYRRTHDARPWQRAASCARQALLVLRWFKERTDLRVLARDSRISIATAYRYLHEGIDVIAARAPDLHDVLVRGIGEQWPFVCLDGTLIPTDRCAAANPNGNDAWYSGKHKRHGANVQVLCSPSGYPAWVSAAEPGSTHDITAARAHALPALYPAAAVGLRTLTDKGYTGAGIGILVPAKGRTLDPDTTSRNMLIAALRAPAERGNALLKQTFKTLAHITLAPTRITAIIAAALVLLHLQRGTR
jgi:hypothetical protein